MERCLFKVIRIGFQGGYILFQEEIIKCGRVIINMFRDDLLRFINSGFRKFFYIEMKNIIFKLIY